MVVESKDDEGEQFDQITILDDDLNLYQFRVNQETKSFEPSCDVRNLSS